MAQFFTLPTEIGQAKIANAIALNEPIEITELAVGDGGGSLPTPQGDEEQLINEVRRAAINSSDTDPDNPNWIVVEQVLPPDVGGWTIREVGIFDSAGDLVAYGNYPETYKPVLEEGSSRTQTVRFVLEVSDTAAVTLKVDPSVVLATREYVDDQRAEHEASRNHPAATETEQGMARIATQAETNGGTDDGKFITAKKLQNWVKQATESVMGLLKVATQAQVNDGTDDTTAITPLKLKGQFSSAAEAQGLSSLTKILTPGRLDDAFKGGNQSLTGNGYQVIPGGMILQWGVGDFGGNNTVSVSLPISFPNTTRIALAVDRQSVDGSAGPVYVDSNNTNASSVAFWAEATNLATFYWFAIGN